MRLRAHEPEMTGIDAEMRNVRAGDLADIKQEAFENNHRKIGKTVAAACILFTVGSVSASYPPVSFFYPGHQFVDCIYRFGHWRLSY